MMTEQYGEGIAITYGDLSPSLNGDSYFLDYYGSYYAPTNKGVAELRKLTGNNDIVSWAVGWSTTKKVAGNIGVIYIDGTEIVGFSCVSDNNQKRLIYDKNGTHFASSATHTKIAKDWYVFPAR
jgi:hypothetical protein